MHGPALWPRRLFHLFAGSSIPIAALFIDRVPLIWGLIALSIASVLAEFARASLPRLNDAVIRTLPLFKPEERYRITGATYLVLAATVAFVLVEKEIAVLALLFLAAGDPAAGIVGRRATRLRLFGKSAAGTAAFALAAASAGLLATLHADVPWAWWLAPGVATAAVVELLPIPPDDNFTVPLGAAVVMGLLASV